MAIISCDGTCERVAGKGCQAPKVTYEGCVLDTYEHNWYEDSDFMACVWDAKEEKVIHIQYATTRGWTYHNGAKVDATEEVIRAAQSYMFLHLEKKYRSELAAEAARPHVGVMVRSLTKRGKNIGVEGKVMWEGADLYTRYGKRVGVKVDGEDKLRYLDAERVEVIGARPDYSMVTRRVNGRLGRNGWCHA